MKAEELSRLTRSLTPDDDPCLATELDPYFEKVRSALGEKSDDILELLDRWLRHSLYEYELLENIDDSCIDTAHFMNLCHSTDGIRCDHPTRERKGVLKANWPAAIRAALAYRKNFKGAQAFENDMTRADFPRHANSAHAAKRYRDLGIQIILDNGDLRVTADEHKKIQMLLYEAIKEIGGVNLLPYIINALQPYYYPKFDRYIIPRQASSKEYDRDPSVPWGLLHRMSLDSLNSREFKEVDKDSVAKTIGMASDLVSLWEVEPYASGGQASFDVDSMFDVLQDAFAFDEAISIRQASFQNVISLCKACFDEATIGKALGITKAELEQFFCFIFEAVGNERCCTIIPQITVEAELAKYGIDKSAVEKLLTTFCPSSSEQTAWKPLSRFSDALYIPDVRTVAEQFFTAIVRSASSLDRSTNSLVGLAFEQHIRSLLQSHGVGLTHGHYLFSGGEGESDAIVETAESIFLLEIKKRDLTLDSRFGSTDLLFRDLMHGLFKSQLQAARAENVLYQSGKLQLKNGRKVELKGRTIERVSIVPFSYGILHYRRIREDALRFLAEIPDSYIRNNLTVSKYDNLIKDARSRQRQIKEIQKLNVVASSTPDFRSHLLNYDMLKYLLNNVSDNETFSQAIIDGSNVEFSTFDWWAERQTYEGFCVSRTAGRDLREL